MLLLLLLLLQDKLFDLEARMIQTTSETAKQTTKVNKLQEKVRSFLHRPGCIARACCPLVFAAYLRSQSLQD
jgi:hypothetical protein